MKKLIIDPFYNLFLRSGQRYDISFFSLLIALIPIALITGPAIPDIIISIVGLYFIIITFVFRLWGYYKNFFVYLFLIFCLFSVLRSIFSEYPINSLSNEGSVFYFRYLFFILAFWYLIDNSPYLLNCLIIIIFICLTVVITDGFYQYFVGVNFFGNEKWRYDRLTGLFGDEPIIGRYVAYMSTFLFVLLYQSFDFNKQTTIISILVLVIAEIFIFLSGERAPLFYISLFSMFVLIFIPKYRLYRLVGFLTSLLTIFFILQINPTAKERMVDKTITQMSSTAIPILPYSELHERHYVAALKMLKSNPVFGVGTNLFKYKCEKKAFLYKPGSCTTHPHNYYLQLLAELGLIGFSFLFLFFLFICKFIYKQFIEMFFYRSNKIIPFKYFLLIIILFVFWWPLIPHMSFYNNWMNILLMMPLGLFIRFLYKKNKNGNFKSI